MRLKAVWIALLAVSCLFAVAGAAPAADLSLADKVKTADALFTAFTPDKPGLAVIVAKDGRVLYERYVGGADLEHGVPVTAASRFHVASVSKQFTAFSALQLSRVGKLDLNADIRAYLPYMPAYQAPITPLELIHHTSGLRDQWELEILSGTPIEGLLRQQQLVSIIARQEGLNFPPGTDLRYSNSGYSLLAEIVAKTSGERFADYVHAHIFQPLGMTDSVVYDDAAMVLRDRAMSYVVGPDGVVRLSRLNYANYGATSVTTTARDLLKWSFERLHPKVFPADMTAEAGTPGRLLDGTTTNYAFGLMLYSIGGHRAVAHGGADAGYRSLIASFPAEDASIIVLSNGVADVNKIGADLAHVFLGPEPPPKTVSPAPEVLTRLAGYYVGRWGPGFDLKVEGGKLKISGAGPVREVSFLADDAFTASTPEAAFHVLPNGDLQQVQAVGGLTETFRRVARVAPTAQALAGVAGVYRSPALDVTYAVDLKGSALVLSSLRADPMPFFPAEADRFDNPAVRLSLVRDASGKVIGFDLGTGRIKALRFFRE